MGRSVADFALPGWAAAAVLQAAVDYAAWRKCRVESMAPQFVVISEGDRVLWAKNVLVVGATDAPGGASVHIQVWLETAMVKEMNANPRTFIGMVPRRQAWKFAKEFLARIGTAAPEPFFRHL